MKNKLLVSSFLVISSLLLQAQEDVKPAENPVATENQNEKEQQNTEPKVETVTTYYNEAEKKNIKFVKNFYKKDGLDVLHGPLLGYYESGKVAIEKNYSHNQLNGEENHWYQDGKPEKKFIWKNNHKINEKLYYSNGRIQKEASFIIVEKDGSEITKKNGPEIWYYDNGKQKALVTWDEGIKNGLETFYNEQGVKKYELVWKNDIKHGAEIHYFENGKVESNTVFENGKPNGRMFVNFKDGTLKQELIWENGKLTGDRTVYNSKGTVIAKCSYKDGEPVTGTLFDPDNYLIYYYENGRKTKSLLCDKEGNLKPNQQ